MAPPWTWKWRSDSPTISLVYLATWTEDGQVVHKKMYILALDSSETVLRSNREVCFAWIWIGICFVNKCSRTHHHFHHLSSPTVQSLRNFPTCSNPRVIVSCVAFSKFSWFFDKFSAWIFPFFASVSSMRIST